MEILFQLIGGGDSALSWVIYIVMFVAFFMFYPRIMLFQIVKKLEATAIELEDMSKKSKEFLVSEISKKPTKEMKEAVSRFYEFFSISPVALDPYGYVKKMERAVTDQRVRFREFVQEVAPSMDKERQANIEMGLAGGMTVHQIAKIVRHFVEVVKKTKSVQIAMILQMQMPLIEKIAKSMYKGTKAMARGWPIGDGIGPLAAADLIGNAKTREIEEIIIANVKLDGKAAVVMRAKGPGGRLGRPGIAVDKVAKANRFARIISIDAAAKLEGEKTGEVAEGVGVAMGGEGVDRTYIEEASVKYRLPLDSIIVKMSSEEAIEPMKKSVKDSLPEVRKALARSMKRVKKGQKVLIIGVGNTSGIGNSSKSAKQVSEWVDKHHKKMQAKKGKKE